MLEKIYEIIENLKELGIIKDYEYSYNNNQMQMYILTDTTIEVLCKGDNIYLYESFCDFLADNCNNIVFDISNNQIIYNFGDYVISVI